MASRRITLGIAQLYRQNANVLHFRKSGDYLFFPAAPSGENCYVFAVILQKRQEEVCEMNMINNQNYWKYVRDVCSCHRRPITAATVSTQPTLHLRIIKLLCSSSGDTSCVSATLICSCSALIWVIQEPTLTCLTVIKKKTKNKLYNKFKNKEAENL